MMRRSMLAAAFAVIASCVLPLQAKAGCTLRFGWAEWEPFHYHGPDGEMRGIDHALVTEAVRRMGCTLLWHKMPRTRAVALLREGRIDAIAGVSHTEEREEYGLFSAPLRPGRNVLIVRRGEAVRHTFGSLEDLADSGFRLGALAGARYSQGFETLVNGGALADNLILVSNTDSALAMLIRGRIDGYIDGQTVARRMIRQMGMTAMVEEHPLEIANHTAFVLFSRRSVDPRLVDRFDAALADMGVDGTAGRIIETAEGGVGPGKQHAEKPAPVPPHLPPASAPDPSVALGG